MNNISSLWVPQKPFPKYIMGKDIFLTQHSTDKEHIRSMVDLVVRNSDDFSKYIDLDEFYSEDTAITYINKRLKFAEMGWLVDYVIKLYSGEIVGGISFVNEGNKQLGSIYFTDKKYRRQGYVSKALQLLETEMAKLGFTRIALEINENNISSVIVANKNKYIKEANKNFIGFTLMDNYYKDITQR